MTLSNSSVEHCAGFYYGRRCPNSGNWRIGDNVASFFADVGVALLAILNAVRIQKIK